MLKVLFSSELKCPSNLEFDGVDEHEKILYIFRKALITNLDWIFVTAALLITPQLATIILDLAQPKALSTVPIGFLASLLLFWYLFTVGFALQNFLNWFFNVYIITDQRILDVDFIGLVYKNISETAIENIEDVTSTVGGTLRIIFNYGSVFIQTAAERREFEFLDVADPGKVRDVISDLITDLRQRRHNG